MQGIDLFRSIQYRCSVVRIAEGRGKGLKMSQEYKLNVTHKILSMNSLNTQNRVEELFKPPISVQLSQQTLGSKYLSVCTSLASANTLTSYASYASYTSFRSSSSFYTLRTRLCKVLRLHQEPCALNTDRKKKAARNAAEREIKGEIKADRFSDAQSFICIYIFRVYIYIVIYSYLYI